MKKPVLSHKISVETFILYVLPQHSSKNLIGAEVKKNKVERLNAHASESLKRLDFINRKNVNQKKIISILLLLAMRWVEFIIVQR